MEEKDLVTRLAGSDQKALKKIYEAYSDYVRTVVRNLSRGTLTAEDIDEITVDVFFRLWKSRGKLDPQYGLRPYLSAIARNAAKDRFRQSPPLCEDIAQLDIPLGLDIEEKAELGEMMSCLKEGLERLSGEEREIFFRFYFYGEKTAEIAKKTGTAENSVQTKLCRTRGKLRDFLTERGFTNV